RQTDPHTGERSRAGSCREQIDLVEAHSAPVQQFAQAPVQYMRESRRRMDRNFFQQRAIARQCDAAVLLRSIDRQNQRHRWTVSAVSTSYTLPLAFMPYSRRCMSAGKFLAMFGGMCSVPFCPVASTREPCPSAATSPIHNHIMSRVARVARVILAEYAG